MEYVPYEIIASEWDQLQRKPGKRWTKEEILRVKALSRYRADWIRNRETKNNKDEEIAKVWLEMEGHVNIYRPYNDPPDYVVNGRHAVEVRRLNRMSVTNGKTRGEEEFLFHLGDVVKGVLEEFGPPPPGKHSWYVDCDYVVDLARLLKKQKKKEGFKKKIREFLKSFNCSEIMGFRLEDGIRLSLRSAYKSLSHKFVLGEVEDPTTGMVLSELIENIPRCIKEKTDKVKNSNKVEEFEDWWLILVDHICPETIFFGEIREAVRGAVSPEAPWSKIIIINYRDPQRFYEL